MKFFDNYESVINCDTIKVRELIICVCNSCNKEYKTTKDSVRKNKQIICNSCKRKLTNIKRYGCEVVNCFGSQDYKSFLIKKYGEDNPQKVNFIREKTQQTNIKKFGTKAPAQNKQVLEKMKQTCFKNNNVLYPAQNKEIRLKQAKNRVTKYYYKDISFDSSWELAFFVYYDDLKVNIIREPYPLKYEINGETHLYFPDFLIDNKLYEIKSDFLIKDGKLIDAFGTKNILIEKTKCMIDNDVTVLTGKDILPYINYVNEKYGKTFLRSCRKDYGKRY